jgi:hypothetical protein
MLSREENEMLCRVGPWRSRRWEVNVMHSDLYRARFGQSLIRVGRVQPNEVATIWQGHFEHEP